MDDYARKRLAIEIAAMLPESTRDSLAVLAAARELVEIWLGKSGEVVSLPHAQTQTPLERR